MIDISFEDVIEDVEMGVLFDELGVSRLSPNDGVEVLERCQFALQVASLDGFYDIEAFRITGKERVVTLRTTNKMLKCAPEHLVFSPSRQKWAPVLELEPGDTVGTKDGIETVIGVENSSRFERLFDLQVEVAHSYFSNGILSHNSHFLTMIGANALKLKKNVLHYTFELSEEQTAIRYDSNLCEIDSSDIIEKKSDVIKKYKESSYGNLIVKYYPTMSVGVPTMRSHIERCSTKNFRPDIIIVDYADVMRSSRQYDSPRHELKMVYEELRGLAGDLGIPVWTASQSNKEGADAEVVDMSNMSEAYAKAMTCDVVITLSRRAQEKALGVGRLFIAKNRAGRDGLVYPISIDTAQSRFTIRGDATLPEDARSEDEQSMKRSILDKWKEIKSQKDLKIEDVNSTKTVEKNKLVTD
jgi:hypothetical protein